MIVWRRREDNPWVHEAEVLVKQLVPVVSHAQTDQAQYSPGPFSMTGPNMVSEMLRATGFDHVIFERYDTEVCIGQSVDEAVEFAMAMGPAGEIIRLAGDEGIKRKQEVVAALRKHFTPHGREDGVWYESSSWFVGARNPTT